MIYIFQKGKEIVSHLNHDQFSAADYPVSTYVYYPSREKRQWDKSDSHGNFRALWFEVQDHSTIPKEYLAAALILPKD